MRKILRSDLFLGLALALAALIVYLKTLSPTVVAEDCGELATTLYTLGITHPTGYPLFTLLGHVVSHLPVGGRVIWKLNVMVALFCAVAVFFFFRLFLFLLSDGALIRWKEPRKEKKRAAPPPPSPTTPNRIAAAVAVLTLAFTTTFWSEALSLEVYALHLVFLSAATLLFLETLAERARNPRSGRGWLLFAYVLGLGFANHMMMVLLAPAFLYLYFAVHGFGRVAWIQIAKAAPPFLLALTAYLYLPIRSASHPLMNWGDTSSAIGLWRHVSGAEYRTYMFASVDVVTRKAGMFFAGFPSEFGYAPILFALIGLGALYRRSSRALIFSLLLFFGCLFYAFNYDFDDPNYYLNSYAAVAIWIAYGIREVLRYAWGSRWRWPAAAACASFVLFPLCLHYPELDDSGNYAVEDYVKNILVPLDSGAVLLADDEKPFLFPAFYFQVVEGLRPDVVVLNQSLLKSEWYYEHLAQLHPWIVRESQGAVDSFLVENRRYEAYFFSRDKDEPLVRYESSPVMARYLGVIQGFLWNSYKTHPVYAASEIQLQPGIKKVADGLVYRLFLDKRPWVPPLVDFAYRPLPERKDPGIEAIRSSYSSGFANQGLYRAFILGDTATGILYLQKAVALEPDFTQAWERLRRLQK